MLFWLGSIEFETPRGRFILTADSAIRLPKRRRATKEEAAQIWPALEARLMYASYDELLPWYELYWELTSERLYGYGYGPGREPPVSNLLRTIELALWSEQLHLEVQEPYDPLPELDEWEPPPLENLRKYIPPQSPSEIWGRRDGAPSASPEEKQFTVKVVDEQGVPVAGISMAFQHGSASNPEKTGATGVASYKTSQADSVSVTFAHFDELAKMMQSLWSLPRGAKQADWLQPKEGKVAVVSLKGGQVQQAGAANQLLSIKSGSPLTISVQPSCETVQFLGQAFVANRSFLSPNIMQQLASIAARARGEPKVPLVIVGHASDLDTDSERTSLALARAEVAKAAFHETCDIWLKQFSTATSEKQRWGHSEELWMIGGLLGDEGYFGEDPLLLYQEHHNALPASERTNNHAELDEDGEMTDKVREQLVADYLHRFEINIADSVQITAVGGADHFPYVPTTRSELDPERLLEIVRFPDTLGILPEVTSSNLGSLDPTYQEWGHRTTHAEEVSCPGGERLVRLKLLDEANKAVTPGNWTMTDGVRVDGGTIDKAGILEAHLSKDASTARLLTDEYDVLVELAVVDEYPAVDSVVGALQRLSNLGYRSGPPADELDDKAKQAVREFQQQKKAKPTGELDSATLNKLKEAYGC